MSAMLKRNHRYFILSFLVLFFFGGRPPEFGQEASFFHGFPISNPAVRIGLGVNLEDVHIRASSGMKIYRASGDYRLIAGDVSEARVKGQKQLLTEKFVLIAAQARRRDEAEKTASSLRIGIDRPVSVVEDRINDLPGLFQVRVGDFLTRTEALAYIPNLNKLGFSEVWIVREEVAAGASRPAWILLNDELFNLDEDTSLYFIPANAQSYLVFGGKSYRGLFVLKGSRRGIVLVNILNLEDYLKGVVPGELSPYVFGEIEALKAQAVAARTYALRNLGQYADLGFDLLATPQSQVYDGMSIEHPLSSRAVDLTKGEVAVYGGRLINALYHSTCGGATEDVEAVFGGDPVPYLKSTECVADVGRIWTLKTDRVRPAVFVAGRNAASALAALAALGVLEGSAAPDRFGDPAPAAETRGWIERAAAVAGKAIARPLPETSGPPTVLSFARMAAEAFGWGERIRTLMGKSEVEHVTRDHPLLKAEDRPLLAFLLLSGVIDSDTAADPSKIITRAEAALALYKAIGLSRTPFEQANLKSIVRSSLVVSSGDDGSRILDIGANPFLLRNLDGVASFTSSLDLEAGDVVRWIEKDGKIAWLQVDSLSLTNVLDQSSQYHSWQVRTARLDLEDRINQYYPVGRLIDVIPRKRGASQRVVELEIIGQASRALVTGLKIRQVLNVRDLLFVIDRETGEDGRTTHFLFSGKGWGHGVGLCQVGAFGMARKGSPYDEILKKYYRGIKIEKRF